MKTTHLLFVCFITLCVLSSCEKESNSRNTVADADYTLADASGFCPGFVLNGGYVQGIAMTVSNTAEAFVNVSTIGNYNISSTSSNGISFSGSGSFTAIGIQTVSLLASGTPSASGSFVYSLLGADTSNCDITVTFDPSPATYTFGGNPGSCTGAVLSGSYWYGVQMNNSNTIAVNVNVTAAGPYSIATTTSNGVSFTGAGTFSSTGPHAVTLTATGIPTTLGTFNYELIGGSTSCVINVTYTSASGEMLSCNIDGGPTSYFPNSTGATLNQVQPPTTSLDIEGAATSPEYIYINLSSIAAIPITPGTYDVNMIPTDMLVSISYRDASGTLFLASQPATGTTLPPPVFSVTITSMTTGPNARITGTFAGPVKDQNDASNVKILSNGVFDLPLH